jgi:hypothetical protein
VKETMHKHMQGLRANPKYTNAMVFLYIEANMSWLTTDDYSLELQKAYWPMTIVTEDPKKAPEGAWKRPGVLTTKNEKELYVSHIQNLLSMDNLRIAKDLYSETPSEIVQKLYTQLDNFRREIIVPKDPNGVYKTVLGGKSIDCKDDIVFAVGIGTSFALKQRLSQNYLALKRANNWPN